MEVTSNKQVIRLPERIQTCNQSPPTCNGRKSLRLSRIWSGWTASWPVCQIAGLLRCWNCWKQRKGRFAKEQVRIRGSFQL